MKKNKDIKPMKVTITLINGDEINGSINIIGFDRFSEFIEGDVKGNIQLFNAITGKGIKGTTKRFIVIPKSAIMFYEPFDEKRNLTHG